MAGRVKFDWHLDAHFPNKEVIIINVEKKYKKMRGKKYQYFFVDDMNEWTYFKANIWIYHGVILQWHSYSIENL